MIHTFSYVFDFNGVSVNMLNVDYFEKMDDNRTRFHFNSGNGKTIDVPFDNVNKAIHVRYMNT